jgi:hypothetical protein
MDNSKIFSKIHEGYKDSFQFLQIFGIFGLKQFKRDRKLVAVFSTLGIVVYPIISLIFGYTSIQNFGQFVEHTTVFLGIFEVAARLINLAARRTKIVEIAESFQELKKFDENGIVEKAEKSLDRVQRIWITGSVFAAIFYCSHQCFFNGKNVYLGWIQFSNEDITIMIGTFDLFVATFMTVIWINSQAFLFMAYTQLTAHLKCLAIKFSKIEKPKNAEDSKENLEKLHEIIEIHQKLKWYKVQILYTVFL